MFFLSDLAPIKGEDKLTLHCQVVAEKAVVLKGKEVPLHQCASESGARFLLAAESSQDSLETVITGEAILKLRELSRAKRQLGFGGGGSFAGSNANSFSGGFGGGQGGFGGFPGGFGGGAGGGFSGASANAGSFGGGFGGFGR